MSENKRIRFPSADRVDFASRNAQQSTQFFIHTNLLHSALHFIANFRKWLGLSAAVADGGRSSSFCCTFVIESLDRAPNLSLRK